MVYTTFIKYCTTEVLLVVLLLLNTSLANCQDTEKNDDLASIKAAAVQFSKNLVAGDADALLESYTEDAKIFPNNLEILSGSELEAYWTPRGKSETTYHKLTPVEVRVLGDYAYDYGYYEGSSLREGQETPFKGKYVVVWKRVEEHIWKMYLDIWNNIADQ